MTVIKVICVGNCNAKKTQLLGVLSEDRYKYDEFVNIHNKMKNYFTCNLAITANFNLEILIFSTEDTDLLNLDYLRRMGYDQAEVMLLVFDVDNPETLRDIQNRWIDECFRYARTAKILLVGVQSDTNKTTAAIQRTINDICFHHHLEYREVSLKTRKGATECLIAIAELACRETSHSKRRRSVGDGFSTLKKNWTWILHKFLSEKQDKQNTEQEKDRRIYHIQELVSLREQSELHDIFKKHEKQMFRHFIVDKVLPLQIVDFKSFGTALGYDPTALKLPRECLEIIKNPYWQMLKFWTEQTEDLQYVCLPLMYRSLMSIKQKVIANDLIESVMAHYTDKDIITKIDRKFHQEIETDEMWKLKSKLKLFMFSKEADQTPPVIWKIGKIAGSLYKDILQAGTESRHCIRLMIVGPFGVGKTCLMRRLLMKDIRGVISTNGINIMVFKCKVRLSDGKWIFSDESDYTKQNLQLRLYKNFYQEKHQLPRQTDCFKISFNQINVRVKEQPFERNDTSLSTSKTTRTCNNVYRREDKAVNENPTNNENSISNSQRNTQIAFHRSGESLLKDFDGLKLSDESMDDFAEVVMLDFAGQYDFYATHQTFLNKHAVYLLVLDISKDLKGISEDLDNALPDLAEIPLKDIGEYVNFWMDAIHCYSENEVCENKTKQNHQLPCEDKSKQNLPSVIVVGTCSDKLEEGKEKSRQKEIEKQLNEILGGHVKSNHIKDFILLSNVRTSEVQFDLLREMIFRHASKVQTWGQELPVRWIKLEQRLNILRTKDNVTVISYSNVIEHGKEVDPAIHNANEIDLFLKYQHETGNIIYFEDIQEYIILQPQWLVDILKCLISAPQFQKNKQLFLSSDWKELETTGRLSEYLLTEIFSQKHICNSLPYKDHILKVMEKFEIIVKPSVPNANVVNMQETSQENKFDNKMFTPKQGLDKKQERNHFRETTDEELSDDERSDVFFNSVTESTDYYVPSLIKSKPIGNIVENFNVTGDQCRRSSWLCMDFHFLPPAFFNHLLVGYMRRYPISIEPSNTVTKLALYRGMGVFNLDESGCIKLAICVFRNIVQFQVWYWQEPSVELNERVRQEAELLVIAIIRRYKMNVVYTLKVKCSSGSYNNPVGMVDVGQLQKSKLCYCYEHAVSHQSIEMLGCWFCTKETNELKLKVEETTELEAKLKYHFQTIVNEIETFRGILDDMISQCLISTDNRSYIEQHTDQQNQTKRLIEIIISRGQEFYSAFLEILRKHDYQQLIESLEHVLVSQMNKQDSSTFKVPVFRVRLQKNYTDIVSSITHQHIVDHLITNEVLTIDDKQIIDASPAQSDKNRKLMEKLMFTGKKGYYQFLDALRLDDCYFELAQQIEYTKVMENEISMLSCCSKLPVQANITNDK